VVHYKQDCIRCGGCAAVDPDKWYMDDEGIAQLKDATEVDDHFEKEIADEDKAQHQEAADVCPVNIIHVED